MKGVKPKVFIRIWRRNERLLWKTGIFWVKTREGLEYWKAVGERFSIRHEQDDVDLYNQ